MKKTCLYCLSTGEWVHYSSSGKTIKLRQFKNGPEPEEYKSSNPGDEDRLAKRLINAKEVSFAEVGARIVSEDSELIPSKLRVNEDWEKWRKVIIFLEENKLQIQSPAEKKRDGGSIVIPQTRIRRFYESLRLFSSVAIHGSFAGYLTKKHNSSGRNDCAAHLQVMFEESADHFARYKNTKDRFAPPTKQREDPWWQRPKENKGHTAKALVASLKPDTLPPFVPVVFKDDGALDFTPIDYEVSPYTTSNATFEDGHHGRKSGQGGVDLLLQSNDQAKLPIIAEVKAPGDTNMFLALVQTLTYAVEFTTPNQLLRLKTSYEQQFKVLPADAKCDIYLIYFAGPSPELLEETKAITDKLLADASSSVAQRVRRIAFIEAGKPGTLKFRCTHLSQPKNLASSQHAADGH
ncbi:MAG: hypothetical protein WCO56_06370 [Verrucomicrobiota bacterium]